MRNGLLLAAASLIVLFESGCAGAQGLGAPPMVAPLGNADPDAASEPSAAQPGETDAVPDSGATIPPDLMPDPAIQGGAPDSAGPPVVAGPPLDVDRVMDSVKKCWTTIPRVYGTEAQGGIARIRLKFQPNGMLDGAPMIMDKPLGPVGMKFATSAAQAIERCQPYRLPTERYAEWRQIEIKFDTIDPDNPPPPAPTPVGPEAGAPPPAVSTPDDYVPSVPAPGDASGTADPLPPQ